MSESAEEAAPFKELQPIGNVSVAPAVGIAAIALNMALKYHDINTVQDGALYQQYKLEGRNMKTLHLDHVFETAIRMEAYLLGASERIAKLLVDAIAEPLEDEQQAEGSPSAETSGASQPNLKG
jgi:hypothetical protein